MNIKEVAQLTGLSHQAIYKKIKANGLVLDKLKDKATGHLTPDGEARIKELFNISETARATDATELTTKVAELTTEVEKLRNQVATMETRITELSEERDFLRMTLERSQHLEAAAIAKLPSPTPPALPPGDKNIVRRLFDKLRGGHHAE